MVKPLIVSQPFTEQVAVSLRPFGVPLAGGGPAATSISDEVDERFEPDRFNLRDELCGRRKGEPVPLATGEATLRRFGNGDVDT